MRKPSQSKPTVFDQRGQQVGQQINVAGDGHFTLPPPPPVVAQASQPAVSPVSQPASRSTDRTPAEFDVFLSHNSRNKPAARDLKQQLAARGLAVWFDEDDLPPGQPWMPLLEAGIKASHSVAVLVGQDGLGPWEDEEMQAALRFAVKDKRPVIPVLLPGAGAEPELPLFLGNRTWVDLRAGLTEAGLDRLQWGSTGKKPGAASRASRTVPKKDE
jgi:hypothetical protein